MPTDCVIEDDKSDVVDDKSMLDNSIPELVCVTPKFVNRNVVITSSNNLYYPNISHDNHNSHDGHKPSHK